MSDVEHDWRRNQIFGIAPLRANVHSFRILPSKIMSLAHDRRLIQFASSLRLLESIAKQFDRKTEAVAKAAKRFGVSLNLADRPKTKQQ